MINDFNALRVILEKSDQVAPEYAHVGRTQPCDVYMAIMAVSNEINLEHTYK